MAKQVEVLETERLILRGIREDDAAEIVKWRSDPGVYRYFKNPKKITIESHLDWYHTRYLQDENRMDWMCIVKETGEKIGVFGLVLSQEEAEVNYLLAPEAQHKGYAREVISVLIAFTNRTLRKKRVTAEIHHFNYASVKLVENLGFKLSTEEDEFLLYKIGERP